MRGIEFLENPRRFTKLLDKITELEKDGKELVADTSLEHKPLKKDFDFTLEECQRLLVGQRYQGNYAKPFYEPVDTPIHKTYEIDPGYYPGKDGADAKVYRGFSWKNGRNEVPLGLVCRFTLSKTVSDKKDESIEGIAMGYGTLDPGNSTDRSEKVSQSNYEVTAGGLRAELLSSAVSIPSGILLFFFLADFLFDHSGLFESGVGCLATAAVVLAAGLISLVVGIALWFGVGMLVDYLGERIRLPYAVHRAGDPLDEAMKHFWWHYGRVDATEYLCPNHSLWLSRYRET